MRALIVEDEPIFRMDLSIRLEDAMSGIEAATKIAQDQSTPIVIMSAYRVNEDEIRRAVPSFVRFVSKPVSDDDLSSAVEHATA